MKRASTRLSVFRFFVWDQHKDGSTQGQASFAYETEFFRIPVVPSFSRNHLVVVVEFARIPAVFGQSRNSGEFHYPKLGTTESSYAKGREPREIKCLKRDSARSGD
jgi:hypothetical protein